MYMYMYMYVCMLWLLCKVSRIDCMTEVCDTYMLLHTNMGVALMCVPPFHM